MKRRDFIQNTLRQLAALALAPSLLASCKKEADNKDKVVIVIGAGISGLAAAKQLQSAGFTVMVLESQDKVGGRLRTDRSLGIAFDEGASWIHGVNGNPITDLAAESGMQVFYTDDSSLQSYDVGGILRDPAIYQQAEDDFYAMLQTLMNEGSENQSFEQVFNAQYSQYSNNRLWKFFLSAYLTFDTGDLDTLSSLLYDEGEVYGGDEKIATNGYDTIAQYLANGLPIHLSQPVSQIDYSGSKIKVSHGTSTVSEADYVIVTVPLGVLKNGTIQFVPALPTTKQTAIAKVGMNCVNKFLLTWDSAFWDAVQYITYTPDQRDKFNYFVNVKLFHPSVNALMTFAYADYARQTETMTDTEIIEEIMTHLKDIYGAAIPYPTHLLRTRWGNNPHAYGSYSYTAVGTQMQHFEDLAAPVNDRLFFAGEHTEVDYFSTAHGAYTSGLRAADEIMDL